MLTAIAISNYRSLRKLVVPLKALNLITGANGSGKSNLYRALRLLADTAQSRVVPSLAREGGLQSTLWAGPESISRQVRQGDDPLQGTVRKQPVNLRLGFVSDEFGYLIDLGLPKPSTSAFSLDPEIKRECIWHGPVLRPSCTLVDRQGPLVRVRGEGGAWSLVTERVPTFDSMMTHVADPCCGSPFGRGAFTITLEQTPTPRPAYRKLAPERRSSAMMGQTSQRQFKRFMRLVIGTHLLRRLPMPFQGAHSLSLTMRDDSRS
jgi:predicted ATPase